MTNTNGPGGLDTSDPDYWSKLAAASAGWANTSAAALLNGTYGPKRHLARSIISSAAKPGDPTAVSALVITPTDTRGTAPATFTGTRINPKSAPDNLVDVTNDPHFEILGAADGKVSNNSSADMCRPSTLTGGAAQAARWIFRLRFWHTGQKIGFYWRSPGTNQNYRLNVNGLPLTSTATQTLTTTGGNRGVLEFDFGSVGTRLLEMEYEDPEIGGVFIEATASVTRPKKTRYTFAGFGDSHTGGANGVGRMDTWVRRAAQILNADYVNLGIGASGFLNGSGAAPDFRTRITPDVGAVAPDVLVFEGSWNDTAYTSAQIAAEGLYCYQQIRAALPNSLLIAAGPAVSGHTLSATLDAFDAALRASAQTRGMDGFISFRDPLYLKATASAWAASTAYVIGDTVTQNGFAQTCVSSHTSAGSFDQTKWRSSALVTGTGRVGTTTGDGSADVLLSNDGVHLSATGHDVKAAFIASEVRRIATAIAGGSTWAG